MKPINFINPAVNQDAYRLLIDYCFSGFKYEQTSQYLKELGYYLPEDQFNKFEEVLDIQLNLDIGKKQTEYKSNFAVRGGY